MKSHAKTIILSLSLLVLFSCLIVGLYASNKYSLYLDSGTSKYKTKTKHSKTTPKLASIEIPETIEENQELEDWMLDKDFWKIDVCYDFDEAQIQEINDIEDWMINPETFKISYSGNNTNSINNKWLNSHNFHIL